jgi:hypothetical protein
MGITQKWLGDYVGWWGDYRTYGGDCELSLRIWKLGYQVIELKDCQVDHLPIPDDLRLNNPHQKDIHKLFSRWNKFTPPKNPVVFKENTGTIQRPWGQEVTLRLYPRKIPGCRIIRKIKDSLKIRNTKDQKH